MKITKKQTQLLHIGKTFLGLPDSQYRLMLSEYWVKSSVDLTYQEASELLNKMVKMGFKIITKRYERRAKSREHRAENIIQMVSPQQLAKIEHLRADVRWYVHDGYQRWLRKWLKKEKIQTGKDAFRVIEGLKGMLSRQQSKFGVRSSESGVKKNSELITPNSQLRRDGNINGGRWQW